MSNNKDPRGGGARGNRWDNPMPSNPNSGGTNSVPGFASYSERYHHGGGGGGHFVQQQPPPMMGGGGQFQLPPPVMGGGMRGAMGGGMGFTLPEPVSISNAPAWNSDSSNAVAAPSAFAGVSLPTPVSSMSSDALVPTKPAAKMQVPSMDEWTNDNEGTSSGQINEELFPPGKTAELQAKIESSGYFSNFIGLEYVIEIQHNTIKKVQANYFCILCEVTIKEKKGATGSNLDLMLGHIKSTAHRMKYLSKHFPRVMKEKIQKSTDGSFIGDVVDKIVQSFGSHMMPRIKIVVGMKLFKRKLAEIKTVVENSTHISENDEFLERVFGLKPTPKFDKYADAFAMLEEEESRSSSKSRLKDSWLPNKPSSKQPSVWEREKKPSSLAPSHSSRADPYSSKRNLDELALFDERVLPTNQSEESKRSIDAAPRPPKDQRSPKDRDPRSQDRYPRSKDPILSMDRDSRSRSKDPILSMERDERSRSRGLSQPKSDSDAPGKELKQSKAKVPVVTGLDNIDSPDLIGAEPISPPRPNEGVGPSSAVKNILSMAMGKQPSAAPAKPPVENAESRSATGPATKSRSRSRSRSKSKKESSSRGKKSRSKSRDRKSRSEKKSRRRSDSSSSSSSRSRSRSRDRSGRKKKDNKKRSLSPFGGGVPPPPPVGGGGVHLDEHRIERYLDEEQLLLERMSLEKKKYMSAPESHPDYSREWERFYNYKRSKHGNINPAYLHDEWAAVWKDYFFEVHDTNMRQKRNELMERNKVYYSDLQRYKKAKEAEAEEKRKKQEEEKRKIERELEHGPSEGAHVSFKQTKPEEVSVMSTLRLLTAIESDLGDLGRKVESALRIMVTGGTPESLLADVMFVEMLKACREVLKVKLDVGGMSLNQQRRNVFKVCIDNITILNQRAAPPPPRSNQTFQQHQPPPPMSADMAHQVKATIAKKVIDEFARAGRQCFGHQLEVLVESEFQRICRELYKTELSVPQQNSSYQQQSDYQHYSSYQEPSWDPQPLEEQDSQDVKPDISSLDASLLDQINWKEIQNVIEKSTGVTSNPSSEAGGGLGKSTQHMTLPQGPQTPPDGSNDAEQNRIVVVATSGSDTQQTSTSKDQPLPTRTLIPTATTSHFPSAANSGPPPPPPVFDKPDKVPAKTLGAGPPDNTKTVNLSQPTTSADQAPGPAAENFDELTIEELASLFKNFKNLEKPIQNSLIDYMKKLEKSNPAKVTDLKKKIHS